MIQSTDPFDGKKRMRLLRELCEKLLKQGDEHYPFVEISVGWLRLCHVDRPDEMLLTARQLVASAIPSQADLRRAVSTAYCSMFHKLSKTATGRFIGSYLNSAYEKFYRSFSHQHMKQVYEVITAAQIKQPFAERLGFNVPTQNVQDFDRGFIELQQSRHEADYNPRKMHNFQDSFSLVQLAEDAMAAFSRIPVQEQNAILICVLIPHKK